MNEYTDKDGVRYVAVDNTPPESCDGCAMQLSEAACIAAPECTEYHRKDRRPIIWVRADKETTK
jgi:hypothetical protein